MNNFIKQVIEEKFASKAQQRFFFAKANEKGKPMKEKKKWGKWAKEFSDKTNFEEIPNKKEKEVDEIVDASGNIERGTKPGNPKAFVTQDRTTDEVVKATRPQQGNYGTKISNFVRYPIEEERLTKEQVMVEYIRCHNDTPYALKTYLQTYDNTVSKYVPLELFPDQISLLKDYEDYEENIALKYRQAGVSTVTAAWASKRLAFAKKNKPEKILIIAIYSCHFFKLKN